MNRPTPKFRDALEVLARRGVRFIVVGGVAAVLEGAPVSTFDLDIVPERSAENVARLAEALAELDARYRDLTGRVLRPDPIALSGTGHHLLVTTCGPLDVLGTIGEGESYAQLAAEAVSRKLGGYTIQVLSLEALIRTKEAAGRDKDRAVLAILRRTLAESTRS